MTVDAEPWVPCIIACPAGAVLEGEPPLEDGYMDAYNSGCSGPEYGYPFQEVWGTGGSSLVFCGVSGWYGFGGADYRDTDWLIAVLDADGDGVLTVEADAEQGLYVFELGPQDCDQVGVVQLIQVGPCEAQTLVIESEPGALVWLWTGPDQFEAPPGFVGHEFDYVLTIHGIEDEVVATESASWSGVKALYR
jgi:hypothetical protein